MIGRKSTAPILAASILAGVIAIPSTSLADWITIRTVSTQGKPVSTKIEMSVSSEAWKDVEGESIPTGGTKLFLDKCDGSTRFKAFKRDNFGFHTRSHPDGVKYCQLPEIVFDDYVPTAIGTIISPSQLGDSKAWAKAFGGRTDVPATEYAEALQSAFAKEEYGFVAIASSELAASLRDVGALEAAIPFESLSIQSTVAGVLQKQGMDPTMYEILVQEPGTNQFVLTPKAELALKEYQVKDLGFATTSPKLGKAGWETMRSLSGGQDVKAVEWKLPNKDASAFDAKVFRPEM